MKGSFHSLWTRIYLTSIRCTKQELQAVIISEQWRCRLRTSSQSQFSNIFKQICAKQSWTLAIGLCFLLRNSNSQQVKCHNTHVIHSRLHSPELQKWATLATQKAINQEARDHLLRAIKVQGPWDFLAHRKQHQQIPIELQVAVETEQFRTNQILWLLLQAWV